MIDIEHLTNEFYLITIITKVKLADKIDDLFHKEGTTGATTFLGTCYDEEDRQSILTMNGQRKEILLKAAHRDQIDGILSQLKALYPQKEEGESFLYITPLSGLAGLEGYDAIESNSSFTDSHVTDQSSYKMVTVVCNHGEGEEYIDATQRQDILLHVLIKGHGTAKLSNKYEGRYFQSEKDIVLQVLKSEAIHELKEFTKAYEAIQFSEAGAIVFTRDIFYLHRF